MYTVTGIKTTRGHDGEVTYHCNVRRNGKVVATYDQDDWGGSDRVKFITSVEEDLMSSHIEGQTYQVPGLDGDFSMDFGLFIWKLIDSQEKARRLKNLSKTKTLFKVEGVVYEDGEYSCINVPYTKKVKDCLDKRHGIKKWTLVSC